jgi:hypothetical protein
MQCSMKCIVGALTVLVLLTTLAIGQQSPFPAAANPSLENNTNADISVADRRQDLPPAMAANQSGTYTEISPSVADRANNESLFPSAANPSLANNTNDEPSPSDVDRSYEENSGLSFAAAASLAR